jgi:sulfite reductase (ferredoxin)
MGTQKVIRQQEVSPEISKEVLEEIGNFETEAQRFLRQEVHPEVFRRFRLQHGIYGQCQEGVQMVRVKIPFGGLNPAQMRCIANLSDEYSRGIPHFTTRQNIQLHFVKLERVGEIMRKLAAVGMTTREACGNTVRTVTASPHSGVCPHEVFDVTPYALATFRLFIRNPICENLPRKFKIAFSDCAQDAGLTPIHDIGLIAMKQMQNGREVPGFRITVGGGLGPSPRKPYVLEEFVPLQEFLAVCEAVVRVFNRYGNRKNRSTARMKFLIDKIGFEQFFRLYQQEYDLIKENRDPQAYAVPPPQEEQPPHGQPADFLPGGNGEDSGNGEHESKLSAWLKTNVIPQKQTGYNIVQVRLIIGDITSSQLRALAGLAERYAHGNVRITAQQNVVLRWVKQEDVSGLFTELERAGLALPHAESIGDVVACPGTDTCGLGITGSKGLGRALTRFFDNGNGSAEDLKGLNVKVSGCPNSCAQHHIASIGFHGMAHKVDGRLVPAYQLHLGGRIDPKGVTFGHQTSLRFPAKRIPEVVQQVITLYRQQRHEGESFFEFVDRIGRAKFQDLLKPYTTLPSFDENPNMYYDWDEQTEYELRDAGQGECAGGVVDTVEQHLEDGKYELANAHVLLEKQKPFDALTRADLAVVASARALLVLEGIDPASNADVLKAFKEKTVASRIIPSELFSAYTDRVGQLQSAHFSAEFARDYVAAARELIDACKEAFKKMDAKLRIKADQAASDQKAEPTPTPSSSEATKEAGAAQGASVHMDLRGVKCPMNYVKAKLRLEMMELGETLELLIDEGEAYENVPRSLKDDGQKILEVEQIAPHYRLVVEKLK